MSSVTGRTTLVGLFGWPVSHSVSPAMHNAAFAELGINGVYVPMEPGDLQFANNYAVLHSRTEFIDQSIESSGALEALVTTG